MYDLVAAWLNGEDTVTGPPTWASLIKALEEPGIANKITEGVCLEYA